MTRWAVNVLPTLPFFYFGNVAILGDAVSPVLLRIQPHLKTKRRPMPWHRFRDVVQDKRSRSAFAYYSLVRKSLRLIQQTYDLGCLDPGLSALRRADHEGHSVSGTWNLFPRPPTPRHRSCTSFAPKRRTLLALLLHRDRPPRSIVRHTPTRNCGADTREL